MSNPHGDQELQQAITGFTLVHALVGFIVGYVKIPLLIWVLIQIVFELWENSKGGIKFWQSISLPVGKYNLLGGPEYKGDSLANSQCDVLFGTLGWVLGAQARKYRDEKKKKENNIEIV